jgi:hypothetical protein
MREAGWTDEQIAEATYDAARFTCSSVSALGLALHDDALTSPF